jgi:hypothetical protein
VQRHLSTSHLSIRTPHFRVSLPNQSLQRGNLIWRDHDLEVHIYRGATEIEPHRDFWWQNASHPKADPDVLLSNARVSNLCMLKVSSGGHPLGMLLAHLGTQKLDFRLGYVSLFKPTANVLAVVENSVSHPHDINVCRPLLAGVLSLLSKREADYAHFPCVSPDSVLYRTISCDTPRMSRSLSFTLEPRWRLEIPPTFSAFLADRSHKTRANIRRNERQLLGAHPSLSVRRISGETPSPEVMFDQILHVFNLTYQAGLGRSPLSSPSARTEWLHLVKHHRIQGNLLFIEDRPVAFSYCQTLRNFCVLMTPGYDPAFSKWNVGQYSLLRLIEDLAVSHPNGVLDYGLGYSQYKESFGTSSMMEGHALVFAPRFKPIAINLVRTAFRKVNTHIAAISRSLGASQKLKRLLRSRNA